MAIENFYIDCIKLIQSETKTDTGRVIKGYTPVNIKGYKGSRSGSRNFITGKKIIEETYNFYTNDLTIKSKDRINYNGDIYEIDSTPKNTANLNHHIKLKIKLLENIT